MSNDDPLEDSNNGHVDWRGMKVLLKTLTRAMDEVKEDVRVLITDMALVKERQANQSTKSNWLTPEKVLAFVILTGQSILVGWVVSKVGGKVP